MKLSAHKNRFTFAILSERPCIMQYRQKIINYESVLNAVLKWEHVAPKSSFSINFDKQKEPAIFFKISLTLTKSLDLFQLCDQVFDTQTAILYSWPQCFLEGQVPTFVIPRWCLEWEKHQLESSLKSLLSPLPTLSGVRAPRQSPKAERELIFFS